MKIWKQFIKTILFDKILIMYDIYFSIFFFLIYPN